MNRCADLPKPCGTARWIDVPQQREELLRKAFATAPRFINFHDRDSTGKQTLAGDTESERQSRGSAVSSDNTPTTHVPGNQRSKRRRQYVEPEKTPRRAPSPTGAHSDLKHTLTGDDKRERYLYLKVNGSSNIPSCVSITDVADDHGFFAELNTEYCKSRGWLRTYLSMWRYDRCHFYRVSIWTLLCASIALD